MSQRISLPTASFPGLKASRRLGRLLRVAIRRYAPPGPIIVKSSWGLANRVYGLLNAIAYAARFGRPLHVDWTDGMYAEAGINAFPVAFSLRNVDVHDTMPQLRRPFPTFCRGRLSADCKTLWPPQATHIFVGFPDLDQWHLAPRGAYDGFVYCARPRYVRPFALAAGLPLHARTVYARHVEFSEPMRRRLAAQAGRTDHSWIGVHYRHTDIQTACPLTHIAKLIKRSGRRSVYWATDNADSCNAIRRLLPHHHIVTTLPIEGIVGGDRGLHLSLADAQREQHLTSACLDLQSLSRCGVIIRKRRSTFGRLAAEVLASTPPQQILIE